MRATCSRSGGGIGYRLLRLAAAALAFVFAGGVFAQSADPGTRRPFHSHPITGQYIVVFKNGVSDVADETDRAVRRAGGRHRHTYSGAIKGFAASMSDSAVQDLRYNPSVAFIEQDQAISLAVAETQTTWGLDRSDPADRALDTAYPYKRTGAGVYAFVIDTGIRSTHSEFTGRVQAGFDTVRDGNGTNDCDGHGTHVAGILGGTTWGVAKAVTLVPVRVLDCSGSGTWSDVIAGIDWVARSSLRPAVANVSLGGGVSAALNAAVANAVASGVVVVVAAGNESANACNSSPASEPTAITVGATTGSDTRAPYSNYGPCVDIFAPGSSITSSWRTSDFATHVSSGTSMAAPYVAGAAAVALEASPSASPAAVALYLNAQATPNRPASIDSGSPRLLLYTVTGSASTQ